MLDHKLKFNSKYRPLIEEDFSNVHRIVSETGKVTFEAGRGRTGHSDVTSAIVLGYQAAKQNPANMSTPVAYVLPSAFGQRTSRLV